MRKSRFTEEQIAHALAQAEAGVGSESESNPIRSLQRHGASLIRGGGNPAPRGRSRAFFPIPGRPISSCDLFENLADVCQT